MKQALVTGANGFIGSALTRRLLRDGIAVRAACRTPAKGATLAQDGAEIVPGDLLDAEAMTQAAQGCDVIFHVGAATNGNAITSYTTNVEGTVNVLRAAIDAHAERFVHVSSIAVYGYDADGQIDESQPHSPSPNDYYQLTKSAGESVMWTLATQVGIPAVSVRPGMVYGPGSGFWSRTVYEICKRWTPFVNDGGGYAHPIYVDDVVDLMTVLAEHPNAPGYAFHATPDPARTWREFVGYYQRMLGNHTSIAVPVKTLRPVGQALLMLSRLRDEPVDLNAALRFMGSHATFSMTRAKERLNWQPRIGLEQGMMLTEPWLRSVTA